MNMYDFTLPAKDLYENNSRFKENLKVNKQNSFVWSGNFGQRSNQNISPCKSFYVEGYSFQGLFFKTDTLSWKSS